MAKDIAPTELDAAPAARAGDAGIEVVVVGAISGNECCKVLAESSWTVARVKGEVACLTGISISDQTLLLGSTKLPDSATLGSLDFNAKGAQLALLRNVSRNASSRGNGGVTVATEGNLSRVSWVVDAKQLMRRDSLAASPAFELQLGDGAAGITFKLMIAAKDGASFKRAGGKARVQLKCFSEVASDNTEVSCSFSIETAGAANPEVLCNPIAHNFALVALCSAPQEFDLSGLAGSQSSRFTASVEITRQGACPVGAAAAAAGA